MILDCTNIKRLILKQKFNFLKIQYFFKFKYYLKYIKIKFSFFSFLIFEID
jgi:hypothetical protein